MRVDKNIGVAKNDSRRMHGKDTSVYSKVNSKGGWMLLPPMVSAFVIFVL